MKCDICGCNLVEIIYDDFIRNGAVGNLTREKYKMYKCKECDVIWHDNEVGGNSEFYESTEYRMQLEKNDGINTYYMLHDKEVLDKFQYTGTDIFRNKIIADIGCGGGSFLDYINGVASKTIAIEPSKLYREKLKEKGHLPYAYACEAAKDFEHKVDVITSFDVIEHVDSPKEFMCDVKKLLNDKGRAIIGTPSDAPIMRMLLGKDYEQFLFSFQHPWILSAKSFEIICKEAGFTSVRIEQKQRYGLGNTMAWLLNRVPKGHISYDFISNSLNDVYKRELENVNLADYLVAYVEV